MNVLLDTNVCIALMRGHPRAVARLAGMAPAACGVSVVSVYELFTGVEKCREPERERAKVLRLLPAVPVLPFDRAAAERSARVRADLERHGETCGPYDLLLAGHALGLGLRLATNNVREFARVEGLTVEDWLA